VTLRIPSSVAEKRRAEAARVERGRRLLRRLLRENLLLARELEYLRADQALGNDRDVARDSDDPPDLSDPPPRAVANGRGALVMVEVNDVAAMARELGDPAAEAAVSEVAGVLRAAVRPTDVCCRLGLGEFVLVMPDADELEVRAAVVRIRTSLMWVSSRRDLPVGVAMGTAAWPADGHDVTALLARARRALSTERRRQRRRSASLSPRSRGPRPALAVVGRRR
jgi:diguanylate cyclase (GGDEF)-like protein